MEAEEIESFSVFEENKVIIFGMALRRFQTLQTKTQGNRVNDLKKTKQ